MWYLTLSLPSPELRSCMRLGAPESGAPRMVVGVLAPAQHEDDEYNDHDEDHGPDTDIHRHSFPGSARSRLSCRSGSGAIIDGDFRSSYPHTRPQTIGATPGHGKGLCLRRRVEPRIWDEAVGSRPCPRLLGQKAALMPGVELTTSAYDGHAVSADRIGR